MQPRSISFVLSSVLVLAAAALPSCGGGDAAPDAEPRDAAGAGASAPSVKVDAPAPGSAEAGAPASVHGFVRFEGTPPARKPLAITATKGCEHDGPAPLSEAVIVNGDKLVNCIVYVSKGLKGEQAYEPPTESVHFDQQGCVYRPHVATLRVGQKMVVHNADPTSHNVHVYSKRTTVPNRTQPAGGQDLEFVFEKAEVPVQVGCDIHPWMRAWLGIFDHPYYALTGEDGAFRIEGLPAGTYTLTAWHEELGKRTAEVELPAGASAELGFAFKAK